MKIASIVGARPQFVKLAPLCRAVEEANETRGAGFQHQIIHTGQHYDDDMSGVFFDEMQIPKPDFDLGVGSKSHAEQTGELLVGLERVYLEEKPDVIVIFGDTNSTLAAALAAAKLHIPIAHVEAGLRSGDRRMPEEINRIVSDHVAALNLAPTEQAMANLAEEGLSNTAVLTGDIMLDAVRQHSAIAASRKTYERYDLEPGQYGIVTVHRAENTMPDKLPSLIQGLVSVADSGVKLLVPLHPRTANVVEAMGGLPEHPGIRWTGPLGYLDMIDALSNAQLAITDSGGVQREAYFLNVPCVTARETTEWPETIAEQANVMVGTDSDKLVAAVGKWTNGNGYDFRASVERQFGDGTTAFKILDEVKSRLA